MIKLVLTDIDDTLIPYGAPCASDRTRAAIHDFLDEGLHFGPVSGRVPNAMGWMFGGDERCFATGAFANGQVVRINGEVVRESDLADRTIDRLNINPVTQVVLDGQGFITDDAVHRADGLLLAVLTTRNNPPARGRDVDVCRNSPVELPKADCLTGGDLFTHPRGVNRVQELPRKQVPSELR